MFFSRFFAFRDTHLPTFNRRGSTSTIKWSSAGILNVPFVVNSTPNVVNVLQDVVN